MMHACTLAGRGWLGLNSIIMNFVISQTLSCNTDLKGLQYKNKDAYFGDYGGQFIPETLIEAHREIAKAYSEAKSDPEFIKELEWYRKEYIGGPTPMHFCKRLTEKVKEELELNQTFSKTQKE